MKKLTMLLAMVTMTVTSMAMAVPQAYACTNCAPCAVQVSAPVGPGSDHVIAGYTTVDCTNWGAHHVQILNALYRWDGGTTWTQHGTYGNVDQWTNGGIVVAQTDYTCTNESAAHLWEQESLVWIDGVARGGPSSQVWLFCN